MVSVEKRITQYNEMMKDERENLPNLLGMIAEFQDGDRDMFDMYFYGYKMMNNGFYDGKNQSYPVTFIRFWDEPLSIFITNMKKRYCRDIKVGQSDGYSERRISYSVNVSNFEESEIDALWYEWMMKFSLEVDLDKFQKDSEAKTLNALRLYIRKSFQNHLKRVNNKRIGLERVRVNGDLYYVKNDEEDVFFEDVYVGSDEEGNRMDFLDTVEHEDEYDVENNEEREYTSKHFIEDNLENVLTKNQYEKYKILEAHVVEHGIESILDKHSGRIIKARVQRVCYSGREYQNIERIDSLIKIMNKRMIKALDKEEISYTPYEKPVAKETETRRRGSECVTYTGGLTQDEVDKYFDSHIENIYKAYINNHLTFTKGDSGMLPSQDSMEEIPFDKYDSFVSGGESIKLAIIREYHNKDKFRLKAGPKEIINKSFEVEPEDRNNRYVNVDQIRDIRKDAGK